MFSAVTNLGAGGIQDIALSDTANSVLYGTFALTGLISGGINNGSFGVRSASELCSNHLAHLSSRPPNYIVYRQFDHLSKTLRLNPEYRVLLAMRSTLVLSGRV